MPEPSTAVAGIAACSALLLAGLDHARHPARTRAAIAAQRLWPSRLTKPVQVGLAVLELLLGIAGLALLTYARRAWLLDATAVLVALAYASLAAYGLILLRWRPEAPCGCSLRSGPVDGSTVLRAAVLGALALSALSLDRPLITATGSQAAITVAAGVTFALLVWHVPDTVPRSHMESP
jgi:Methylamine utilisation protein MauE